MNLLFCPLRMEHRLPTAVAGAAAVAVGTSKRGFFWGGDVHWGKGSPEALLTEAGNTSPSLGGEPSSSVLFCWSSRAAKVDVFNFGICDGNLQGAAGALEAEQEQAGAPRTSSEGKEVNKP